MEKNSKNKASDRSVKHHYNLVDKSGLLFIDPKAIRHQERMGDLFYLLFRNKKKY